MTKPGSPVAGSLKVAEPPTGTTEADPSFFPGGIEVAGAAVVEVEGGAAVVGADVVGGVDPDPKAALGDEELEPPRRRPTRDVSPPARTAKAASAPVAAPLVTSSRRDIAAAEPRRLGVPRVRNQVSRAGAPPAPARSKGV